MSTHPLLLPASSLAALIQQLSTARHRYERLLLFKRVLNHICAAAPLPPAPPVLPVMAHSLTQVSDQMQRLSAAAAAQGLSFKPGELKLWYTLMPSTPQVLADVAGQVSFWLCSGNTEEQFTLPLSHLDELSRHPRLMAFAHLLHAEAVPADPPPHFLAALPLEQLLPPDHLSMPHAPHVAWVGYAVQVMLAADLTERLNLDAWEHQTQASLEEHLRANHQVAVRALTLGAGLLASGLLWLTGLLPGWAEAAAGGTTGAALTFAYAAWLNPLRGWFVPSLEQSALEAKTQQARAAFQQRDALLQRRLQPLSAALRHDDALLTVSTVWDHSAAGALTGGGDGWSVQDRVQQQALLSDQQRLLPLGERITQLSQQMPEIHPAQAKLRALHQHWSDLQAQLGQRLAAPPDDVIQELDELERILETQQRYLDALPPRRRD